MIDMVTIQEIEKLASLARVELKDAEKEKLRADVDAILGYVSELQKISGIDGEGNHAHSQAPFNVMREDGQPHESGIYTETLVGSAPRREGDYVKVKKIL